MLNELAAAIRAGTVAPKELVQRALTRIDAANGALNAVVQVRAEEAIAEAESLDDERRRGPLAGLPLLVKDLTDVAGLPTTYGSKLYADAKPAAADATIVARLRAAGAIVVGKTNTPAFGWTGFTDNLVFGASRNPWNTDRSPGGSSGGSGAALAAALAPLATTTDGGGSVRIPASMCGLVGYKPTLGTIGRDHAPRWITFSTSGATGASVADVVTEAAILAGPTGTDLNELPTASVAIEAVRPARVVACRTLRRDVDPAVEAAFDRTLGVIERDIGVPVERVERVFDGHDLPLRWFTISAAELAQSLAWCEAQWDTFEPGLTGVLRYGASVQLPDYLAAQRARYDAAERLSMLLGDATVLVTPTCNVTSWAPEGPLPDFCASVRDDPGIALNTVEFNFTGHPAVTVPIGTAPEGVPIGMQVIAPRFADRLALGLAAALEVAQPWPRTAPGYEPFFVA